MGYRPTTRRSHLKCPGVRFCRSDQFRHGLCRKGRRNDHDAWNADDSRDRRDVAGKIVLFVIVNRRINYVSQPDQKKGMGIDWCPSERLGCRIAALAEAVLDDKFLAHMFGEPASHQSCTDIECTADSKRADDADRTPWIDRLTSVAWHAVDTRLDLAYACDFTCQLLRPRGQASRACHPVENDSALRGGDRNSSHFSPDLRHKGRPHSQCKQRVRDGS